LHTRNIILNTSYLHDALPIYALNDRSREVLRAIAQGLHPREVAEALHLDSSTISYYAGKIYRECRNVWDVPGNLRLDYHFVQARSEEHTSELQSPEHLVCRLM